VIYYIRDEEGSLIGLKYNNMIYYYIKNIQEDIIGLMDSNYNLVCSYEYDSWGSIISIKDNNNNEITDTSHIGLINPYRYRSYYYDTETKLYYLNSRYYNPEWGRFINADNYVNTKQGMLSINMFVYTENNPIIRVDKEGELWFQVASTIFGGAIGFVTNGMNNLASGNSFFDGAWGAFAGGAFTGLISSTPLARTKIGQSLMNTGSSFITNSINELESSGLSGFNSRKVFADTVIDTAAGKLPMIEPRTNRGRNPKSIRSAFTGKKQINRSINQAASNVQSNIYVAPYRNNKPQKPTKPDPKVDKKAAAQGMVDFALSIASWPKSFKR